MMLLSVILAAYTTQEEQDQVTALFEAHHWAMYHEVRLIPASHEDAEDAVQEAFIVLHDHLYKLTDITSQKTRAYVILAAKNIAKNKLRKQRRERSIPLDEMSYELPDKDERIYSKVEIEAMLAEIEALPETSRDILLFKLRHQCSDKELAAIMGIKHDAVRKRVERARAILEGRLKV